jgi:uncharacterized repeat protein (TIGR04052 family)
MLDAIKLLVAALVATIIIGCEPSNESGKSQSFTFKLALNNKLLTCADLTNGVLLQGQYWQIDTLKFFVHQLVLVQNQHNELVELIPSDWQTNRVALLSLEPGLCAEVEEQADEVKNQALYFKSTSMAKTSSSIRLTIGVPFEENHKNPLIQPSPLNLPIMFWSWQLGHKFLRWDMTRVGSSWSYHLGSIGCESASSVRAPKSPCIEPNTVSLELNKPNNDNNTIWIHLDRVIEGLDLNDSSSCVLHGTTESSCATLIQNLHYNEVFEWR